MKAIVFPGQGSQKAGMGTYIYNNSLIAKKYFESANDILGRRITDVMFFGDELELMETKNTQPAVFLFGVILALTQKKIIPDFVAGHSLGEFSALVVNKTLSFEDGLNLVANRAQITQEVCESQQTAMGAVIGLPELQVENRLKAISAESGEAVYLANYNGPGQLVITGTKMGVRLACKAFKAEGAKRAVPLPIGGSFHSPFMAEAEKQLGEIINQTKFRDPEVPIFQCVDGVAHSNSDDIKQNLVKHITHPVLWTSMVHNMVNAGVGKFYESGPDDTLQKIIKRMYPQKMVSPLGNADMLNPIT